MAERQSFKWERQPQAEKLILDVLEECRHKNPFIDKLQNELHKHTSTRLFDWLDHVVAGHSEKLENELEACGFVSEQAAPSYRVFFHPGAQLPKVVVKDEGLPVLGVGVKVDSIADFLMVWGLTGWIEGSPCSGYRRCCVSVENDVSLWVVERRKTHAMEPLYEPLGYVDKYLEAIEKWQTRPRDLEDEEEALSRTLSIAGEIVHALGQDMAAWIVMECERKYWQARNTAGQVQKNRQDKMGMGWANHDHHTFRSSRRFFPQLVRLFEMLGFHCRERFYAGEEAGWGAQVMENPRSGLVLFLDLDLSPEELEIDFAHHALPEIGRLGTIGLWCALHGDSILKAGMHHLEAQFLFEGLKEDLEHYGVGMMDPFSDFSYLKQAFTHGEQWTVNPRRISKLHAQGLITSSQADSFLKYGAVGSHLENLQRREGYKGFNQKNVSVIIQKTDPRTLSTL